MNAPPVVITTVGGESGTWASIRDVLVDRVGDLARLAEESGTLLAIEPHVGQALVRDGAADSIGLGRMVLSYPDLPADVIEKGAITRKLICRTFSDCTTAPRNGMISGCYPLDAYYKDLPEATQLKELKAVAGD